MPSKKKGRPYYIEPNSHFRIVRSGGFDEAFKDVQVLIGAFGTYLNIKSKYKDDEEYVYFNCGIKIEWDNISDNIYKSKLLVFRIYIYQLKEKEFIIEFQRRAGDYVPFTNLYSVASNVLGANNNENEIRDKLLPLSLVIPAIGYWRKSDGEKILSNSLSCLEPESERQDEYGEIRKDIALYRLERLARLKVNHTLLLSKDIHIKALSQIGNARNKKSKINAVLVIINFLKGDAFYDAFNNEEDYSKFCDSFKDKCSKFIDLNDCYWVLKTIKEHENKFEKRIIPHEQEASIFTSNSTGEEKLLDETILRHEANPCINTGVVPYALRNLSFLSSDSTSCKAADREDCEQDSKVSSPNRRASI